MRWLIWPSVQISKFVRPCGAINNELRNPKDTRKSMILVRLWDLKFLDEVAAGLEELQIPPH